MRARTVAAESCGAEPSNPGVDVTRRSRRSAKHRLTKAQAKAKLAELQAKAVEVVAQPGFAVFKAADPLRAALWTALAKRAQQPAEEAAAGIHPPDDG